MSSDEQVEAYEKRHKDGSIWAKGQKKGDTPVGYWEWFRKDGTRLRSGHFDEDGEQVGEWTTYDQEGEPYKVTQKGGAKGGGKGTAKGAGKGTRKSAGKK